MTLRTGTDADLAALASEAAICVTSEERTWDKGVQ